MDWKISLDLVDYSDAVAFMEDRVAAIRSGAADETVWLLEHPPLYTAGTSAKAEDLLDARFPVFQTGRGGEYTYHGPGQKIAYVMLDLKRRQSEPDIKKYIHNLEQVVIDTFRAHDVDGYRIDGKVGIWVDVPMAEGSAIVTPKKIAAIGVRIRHWVTYHGVSMNLSPDLSHFNGIVPCGIKEFGVTSLFDLNKPFSNNEFDDVFKVKFENIFGA